LKAIGEGDKSLAGVEDGALWPVPSTVPGASSWAVPRGEALSLGIICEKHDWVHMGWGATTLCPKCREEVSEQYTPSEWGSFCEQLADLVNTSDCEYLKDLLEGFGDIIGQYFWLKDVISSLCAIVHITPQELLERLRACPQAIEQITAPRYVVELPG
jgi:hypothetical protein